MRHAYFMIEWCDGRVGRDVLLDVVKGASGILVPETVHPLAGLDSIGDHHGEAEIHFTVGFSDYQDSLRHAVEAVRAAGLRVKYARKIPSDKARLDAQNFWYWENQDFLTGRT